jgi:CelD/BcsL family acetyltransferase involved in cellulose biosynthesis
MISWYNDFILRLCFDNSIDTCFQNKIRNKLTGREFSIPHNPSLSVTTNGHYTIRDLPDYLNIQLQQAQNEYNLIKIPQYKGYLVNLIGYRNIEEYLSKTFSRNPRKTLRSKIRNLEAKHEIRYEVYFGEIDKDHYEYLVDVCYELMKTRFKEKKIHNRYLLDWKYYVNLFYPKILKKEASLFVIYDNELPITLTLNFLKADVVFSFIQIYDTRYFRFSMGDIAVYKNLDWCFQNNFRVFDFSKGATHNKLRWSNHHYRFNYLLFYSDKSLKARFLASKTNFLLRLKQFLRDKGIIGGVFQMDRILYYVNKKKLEDYDWKNP